MMKYSVLMAVYAKEKPAYFRTSIESMLNQTIGTDDFVIVCDGSLTAELDSVISMFVESNPNLFNIVRLNKNIGLGNALNEGMKYCKNELIARMDSDDISIPERCALQLQEFEKNQTLDIISGTVCEFSDSIDNVIGKRVVPENYKDICKFSKKRSPFNHPAVMYKKTAVINSGGYSEKYHLLEDYYLWLKMLINGAIGKNLKTILLYMRVDSDTYNRRGGGAYAKSLLKLSVWSLQLGWTSILDILFFTIPHCIICVLPNKIRSFFYKFFHRRNL